MTDSRAHREKGKPTSRKEWKQTDRQTDRQSRAATSPWLPQEVSFTLAHCAVNGKMISPPSNTTDFIPPMWGRRRADISAALPERGKYSMTRGGSGRWALPAVPAQVLSMEYCFYYVMLRGAVPSKHVPSESKTRCRVTLRSSHPVSASIMFKISNFKGSFQHFFSVLSIISVSFDNRRDCKEVLRARNTRNMLDQVVWFSFPFSLSGVRFPNLSCQLDTTTGEGITAENMTKTRSGICGWAQISVTNLQFFCPNPTKSERDFTFFSSRHSNESWSSEFVFLCHAASLFTLIKDMFSVDDCEKTFFLLSTFSSKYLFKVYIFYIWEEDIVPFYHSFSYFSDRLQCFLP